ncbi:mannitol dehydrogenase family protein [Saccharopolyspora sp. 6T]|uniref:mannitol dehydrogenase family protein n=1 Tax=Saccharopolyspora sp. 6T TaxID=2877238 RepID=UPI001CD6C623|nr:mannitol dehydrogenase family protein [Saccharopolyspora sp. 6T]MCA1188819.1 mannitol dehydrogenase family protein [Saccharopolyspora sp. 6T]
MTTPRLGASTAPAHALLRPAPPERTGIVHLGLGNFHRAHQAVHTARALAHTDGPWGILGVAGNSTSVATAMREQELRYAVLESSPAGSTATVPGVHTGALVAAHEPEAVLDAIAAPDTRIVTITVTERGYTYSPRTRSLDLDSEPVRADLRGDAPPRTTTGRIVRGLQRRMRAGSGPITVLSCDNLGGNGRQTARLVREFTAELPAPEREELQRWTDASVTFPNSMVDRIVPATTDAHRAEVRELLGVRDAVPVPAEPFSMWVLEDDFAAGRPAWERSGVLFADDVEAYELLKLRLLNGTHSLIAYLGALDGCDTIPEAIARPFIAEAADRALRADYLPTLAVPAAVDAEDYIASLFQRWANSALGHRTRQVGSDGSVKLAQRVPDPVLAHLRAGRMPQQLALTVAAYLRCLGGGADAGPHAAAMSDPARESIVDSMRRGASSKSTVDEVLGRGLLGAELAGHADFTARVAELLDLLVRHGPKAAAAAACTG